jgi:hypothetical protein
MEIIKTSECPDTKNKLKANLSVMTMEIIKTSKYPDTKNKRKAKLNVLTLK